MAHDRMYFDFPVTLGTALTVAHVQMVALPEVFPPDGDHTRGLHILSEDREEVVPVPADMLEAVNHYIDSHSWLSGELADLVHDLQSDMTAGERERYNKDYNEE